MGKSRTQSSIKAKKDYIFDYQAIMNSEKGSQVIPVQWRENGDSIQKFSMYEEYTPVKTSGSTTLLAN